MIHWLTLAFLTCICSAQAWAGVKQAHCKYNFMGAPTAEVILGFLPDSRPEEFVTVVMYGKTHQESATPEKIGPGELSHIWISKESADNSLEMIIYQQAGPQGQSKLINPHVPFAKEMWGSCEFQ